MKFFFFFILPFIAVKSSAQTDIICLNLTDSTQSYFYIGVDNPIKVTGQKFPDNYSVNISGGSATITKVSPNNYIVRVTSVTDEFKIWITDKKGKIFFEKTFKTRTIPAPIETLSGLRDTTLSRNRILLNPFLSIVFPECYFRLNMPIISFDATFINAGDSISTIGDKNFLSKEQIKLIKEMEPGTKIYFSNFRTLGPDDGDRYLRPFWIRIE